MIRKLSYKVGLKKIVEDLFEESTICKVEQMSNWERRPLRQS
jgi:ribonuclease D